MGNGGDYSSGVSKDEEQAAPGTEPEGPPKPRSLPVILLRIGVQIIIVILLLLILAAVIIPSYLEPCTRSKVSKAVAEIRNVGLVLERYYVDHNLYPPPCEDPGNVRSSVYLSAASGPDGLDWAIGIAGNQPIALTTPVAYMSVLPADRYRRLDDETEGSYQYGTDFVSCWIMTSYGPDRDSDIDEREYPSRIGPNAGDCKFRRYMSAFGGPGLQYDPSNGTTSDGDLPRVAGGSM